MRYTIVTCDICGHELNEECDKVGSLSLCERHYEKAACITTSVVSWGDLCIHCMDVIESLLQDHKKVRGTICRE